MDRLRQWQAKLKDMILEVRGIGLLIAMEVRDDGTADSLYRECLNNGLIVNVTQGTILRLLPALTISPQETEEGLAILEEALHGLADTNTQRPG